MWESAWLISRLISSDFASLSVAWTTAKPDFNTYNLSLGTRSKACQLITIQCFHNCAVIKINNKMPKFAFTPFFKSDFRCKTNYFQSLPIRLGTRTEEETVLHGIYSVTCDSIQIQSCLYAVQEVKLISQQ